MANPHFDSHHMHSAAQASSYRAGEKVRDEDLIYKTKAKHQEQLDSGIISEKFRKQLADKEIELSDKATVEKYENRWEINDDGQSYTIREHMVGKTNLQPQLSIYKNLSHDYSSRSGVRHSEIMTPENAPKWAENRSDMWCTAQSHETHIRGRSARETVAALPREFNLEQQKACVRQFAREQFLSRGMIVDLCIHESPASDGGTNPHVHFLTTTRELDGNAFAKTKNREWDKKDTLQEWRDAWERIVNKHLEDAGSSDRISLNSYQKRGVIKEAGKHLGKDKWNAEQNDLANKLREHNNRAKFINDHRARYAGQPVTKETYNRWYDTNSPKMNYIIDSDNLSPDALKHREMMNEHMEGSKTPTMQEVALRNAKMQERGSDHERSKDR